MDAIGLLTSSLSPDKTIRARAEAELVNLLSSNPTEYLLTLSKTLLDAATPVHLRTSAGLAIKNTLSSRDNATQLELNNRWLNNLDQQTRQIIKSNSLQTLADASKNARQTAAQVIAAIASIELPLNQWNDLISTLLECMNNQSNEGLRQATLQTIGYVCEAIVSSHSTPSLIPDRIRADHTQKKKH